jgi:hypothetical protein
MLREPGETCAKSLEDGRPKDLEGRF